MQSQQIETPKPAEVRQYRMLIGSERVGAGSGETFESTDPYTSRVWARIPGAGDRGVVAS